MAKVTYDDRSYILDGERIWLVSGSIHYFRAPAEHWGDLLLKAKRGGLNCIETYIPWNFHEPREGQWELTGDKDVVAFVQKARELGLYVILRPGPYITAEWDGGGLPGWLASKPNIAYRTNNASFMHYFDRYFRQILPRLAELQVTNGGNIILVQNENEYPYTTQPDAQQYLDFISQLIRRSGFEVPIIDCNMEGIRPAGSVACWNGFKRLLEQVKRLRSLQPMAPMLVTELWSGWFDAWGLEHQTVDAAAVARRALEMLGCGAQYNLYMFHGGTNFGFWGARLGSGEGQFQTTSYDYDAPIAEGGGLSEKYYALRLVNMPAMTMGKYIANCVMDLPAVDVHDSTNVLNISGPRGRWAVITNSGRDDITSASISLPEGRRLGVSLEPLGAVLLPVHVTLWEGCTLDYANVMPFAMLGDKVIVFHAPAGFEARVSINGQELLAKVPQGEPLVTQHQGLTVVLMTAQLARRTWLVEQTLVIGADFVGASLEDISASGPYMLLDAEGKLSRKKVEVAAKKSPARPRPGAWKLVSRAPEVASEELAWHRLDGPRDVDHLGQHLGYTWYRVGMDQPRATTRRLMLPHCSDRAQLYLNGRFIGTWGRGPGATREPIFASFRKGQNTLVALVDNLGRPSYSLSPKEFKGLFGHVYDAKPLRLPKLKLKQVESFNKRLVPRHLSHMLEFLGRQKVHSVSIPLRLTKVSPVAISFSNLPRVTAILCNDRVAGFFPMPGGGFGEVVLGPELRSGANQIEIIIWGEVDAKTTSAFSAWSLVENLSQKANWSWRPWARSEQSAQGGDKTPAWFTSSFKLSARDEPLFVRISGGKGQLFLNGQNVGRVWDVGPQRYYHLPKAWLREVNELVYFDEHGSAPSSTALEFRPLGPYR